MSKYYTSFLSFLFILSLYSCDKDEYYIEDVINTDTEEVFDIVGKIGIKISKYMNQSGGGYVQGADSYGVFLFQFHNANAAVNIYNLREKVFVETVEMIANKSNHCNNASFSRVFFNGIDEFPLLYVSGDSGTYNHVQVYRITRVGTSFTFTQIQEIILPKATKENNLYWSGVVVDNDNNCMYIYANKNRAQIAKLNIPDINQEEVVLTDEDVLDIYTVEKFNHQQGAVINNGKMYVFDGVPQWGDTNYLRIIDLEKKVDFAKINITEKGLKAEPEGAFIFNDILYCATNNSGIFKIHLKYY